MSACMRGGQVQPRRADSGLAHTPKKVIIYFNVIGYKGAASDLKLLDRVLLGEVKAYNTPPPAMERVLSVAIILSTPPGKAGTWDVSWPRAKRTISNADRFVMDLLAVDPEQVSPERIAGIKPYFENYASFTPVIHELSEVLSIVWDWGVSVWEYIKTFHDTIVPLEKEKEQAREEVEQDSHHLSKTQEEVMAMEKEIAALSNQFETASSRKSMLQAKAKGGLERHENAKSLIARLETDEPFWKRERADLTEKQKCVVGDSLLGALLVVYCGPLSQEYRNILITNLSIRMTDLHIPFSSAGKTGHVFFRPEQEYDWYNRGLPSLNFGARNTLACENYIITHETLRCPLWVDPDGIALKWCHDLCHYQHRLGKDDHQVISSGDGFAERLKICVENGLTVVCNMLHHQCDSLFQSLLQMRVVKKGKDRYLEIGGSPVQLGRGFKLMLRFSCDTLPFPSEVTSKCSIINFAMGPQDLEDCLLTIATAAHQPHVLEQRPVLLKELIRGTLKVAHDKDAVIQALINISDNLSDMEEVEKISKFKTLVDTNREKLQIAEKKMADLHDGSARYKSFAHWLTSACIQVEDARRLETSYVFSAKEMIHIVDMYLAKGRVHPVSTETQSRQTTVLEPESADLHKAAPNPEAAQEDGAMVQQMKNLAQQCIAYLHLHLSHALAQQHRHPFLVHSYFQAQIAFGSLDRDLYSNLVNNSLSRTHKVDLLCKRGDAFGTLLPLLSRLVGVDATDGPTPQSTSVDEQWRTWMNCENPEEMPLPSDTGYSAKKGEAIQLDHVQKMLLLLVLRPDRVGRAVTKVLNELSRIVSDFADAVECINGMEDVLQLQHSMHDAKYVPERMRYPCLVPLVLHGAQEMEMCNEVLCMAGDTSLLAPSQKIHIISASNPNLEVILCECVCNDSWVFIRDVPLCAGVCDLVNNWLQNLALTYMSPNGEDEHLSRICRMIQSTYTESGGQGLKKPHEKFRLFIAVENLTRSLLLSFASLWNNCIRLNCTQAASGLLSSYSRLSRTVLRGRSHDAKIDNLAHILQSTLLMHIVWNRLSVGVCGWRFPYTFDPDDISFGKDRIVELLIARQVCLLLAIPLHT